MRAHAYGLLRTILGTAASDGKIGRESVRDPRCVQHSAGSPDQAGEPSNNYRTVDRGDARTSTS